LLKQGIVKINSFADAGKTNPIYAKTNPIQTQFTQKQTQFQTYDNAIKYYKIWLKDQKAKDKYPKIQIRKQNGHKSS